ncbi:MAG: L,D-transpeptidase family protein [Clostridiaceae bacterium]
MSDEQKRKNKIFISIIVSNLILIAVYFSLTFYFRTHFYFGSSVNSISISGKTIEDAEKILNSQPAYSLELDEIGGKKEYIKEGDIDFKYNFAVAIRSLKDRQNPFGWVYALINKKDSVITESCSYNEELLKKYFNNLSCFTGSDIIEPQNSSFKYTDNGYVILDEINGNKVNKEALYTQVVSAISKGERTINLESANCYLKPQYTSGSQKVKDIKDTLNKYISSKITYIFGDKNETIDGSLINGWLQVDNNMEIIFDEAKMRTDLNAIFSAYETVGKTRNFVTTSGNTIQVSGGDYGWFVNTTKEIENSIAAIKEGQTITKEPEYAQTASSHSANDIGNTYVEVDLARQHLWFYKNGSLIVEGDVVSGNVSRNNGTPAGVYRVKYKERDATLVGEDYKVPVSFWMPFNGGIGLHDASWRSSFGGELYKTNGSHGCVNMPYYLANAIYDNIQPGNPVICYY